MCAVCQDFFGALANASATAEWKALEAAHELGVSFYHETSHLLPSHHAYFHAMMELARRTTGRYEVVGIGLELPTR